MFRCFCRRSWKASGPSLTPWVRLISFRAIGGRDSPNKPLLAAIAIVFCRQLGLRLRETLSENLVGGT